MTLKWCPLGPRMRTSWFVLVAYFAIVLICKLISRYHNLILMRVWQNDLQIYGFTWTTRTIVAIYFFHLLYAVMRTRIFVCWHWEFIHMDECEHCINWCKYLISYPSDVCSGILATVLCGREILTRPFSDIWAAIKKLLWFCMFIIQCKWAYFMTRDNTLGPVGQ